MTTCQVFIGSVWQMTFTSDRAPVVGEELEWNNSDRLVQAKVTKVRHLISGGNSWVALYVERPQL